jgi:hypothetical protein
MKDVIELHKPQQLFPITEVRGLTGQLIRETLNTLVKDATVYLECGVYCGLSFTSAMYGNTNIRHAIAIDSWAERFGKGIDPRKEFMNAVAKYYPGTIPLTLIESDHWQVKVLPDKPDLFYYDGDHSEDSQRKALTHYGPMCTEEFTFCCDDWNWIKVRKGTQKGLDMFTVVDEWELFTNKDGNSNDPLWWNGFYIAKLRQK